MPRSILLISLALAFLLSVGVLGLVVAATQVSGISRAVVIIFAAATAWIVFRTLYRRAYELELHGDQLRWKAPLVTGECWIGDLSAVRPSRLGPGIWVFTRRDSFGVSVPVRKGFRTFLQELQAVRPDLPISTDVWSINYAESLPWASGFSREA